MKDNGDRPDSSLSGAERIRWYRERYPERYRAIDRQYRERLKSAILGHYGRACACCGSTERLSVDHIAGDGGEHRRQVGNGHLPPSTVFHRWLITNGFPAGFQILCHWCNRSKANGPSCRLDHGKAQ